MNRTDLEGLRVRMAGTDAVYLIDKGQKRHISYDSYVGIFRDWNNIHVDLDVEAIDSGPDLVGAFLFQCVGDPQPQAEKAKVFLYDTGKKRHVGSPAAMDRFQFDWSKIHKYNIILSMVSWPDGPEITKTGRPD